LFRGCFARQFRLEAFRLSREGPPPDFPQNRLFTWEISKKRGLTDFERLHDIVDARIFVTPLAEEVQSGFHDLLALPRFLAFA
jgi:hypothetical protein